LIFTPKREMLWHQSQSGCLSRMRFLRPAFRRFSSNSRSEGSSSNKLAERLVAGDRVALSRAITLVESSRADHQAQASELLNHALHLWRASKSGSLSHLNTLRLGISGSPGVGKSTFIEAFGNHLTRQGNKVAVLAVDPSSSRTGGSILGDKTRMTELSRNPSAYVRPSPTSGILGGVSRHTDEVIMLCECAGFDMTIIETVGVGQSEVSVTEMVDLLVLLVSPGGGDEIQCRG